MTESNEPWSGQADWHVANWGPWGWAETAIKAVAIAVAVIAALGEGGLAIPDTHQASYWILVVVAAGYLGAIGDRLTDKEVTAMAFVVATVVGHWALVFAMGRPEWPGGAVRTFAGLMLLGDIVKIGYFVVTGAQVRDLPRVVPIVMTGTLATAYLVAFLAA